jgi:hypothetical protein
MKRFLLSVFILSMFCSNLSAQPTSYDAKFNITICTKARNASAILYITNGSGNTFTGTLYIDTYQRSVYGWYIQTICEGGGYNYSTDGLSFYVDLNNEFQYQQLFKATYNFDKTYISGTYFYFGNEFIFYGTKDAATSSIETDKLRKEIKIYPNPSESYLYLETDVKGLASVEIYDVFGRLVVIKEYTNPISIASLEAGGYILKLIDNTNNSYSLKFTKN